MDPQVISTIVIGAMLAMFTTILAWLGKSQVDDIKHQMTEFRAEVHQEIHQLRSEMAAMRSDITQIALALGPRPRPQTG